jgi:hypothetical protein
MVITNVEKLTGLRFCTKCGLGFRTSDHHRDRFTKHCEECDGKFHTKLKLNSSLAFVPHIMKNKALQYMLSHKIDLKNYKPVSSYITYDFETMNNTHVDNSNTKAIKIENTLHLLSFAFTIVINSEITNTFSYYLDDYESEEAMVYAFLDNLSSYAIRVMKRSSYTNY